MARSSSRLKDIDRTGPVPLYEQIRMRLLADLESLPEGEQHLLSDAALMERFGVSRMTARNAIAELVRRGVVDAAGSAICLTTEVTMLHTPLTVIECSRGVFFHDGEHTRKYVKPLLT